MSDLYPDNPAKDIPGLNRDDYAIVTGYPFFQPSNDANGRVVQLRGHQGPGHQRSFVLATDIAREAEDPDYWSRHMSFHSQWLRPVGVIEALGSLANASSA